jgi:hypothetical protein
MFYDEILNEKIFPHINGFFNTDISNIICMLFSIIIVYYLYNIIINSDNKVKTIFILIIIIFFILLYINQRLNTNKKFSKIKMELNKIKSTLNTGDIVMFRSYYVRSLSEIVLYKILLPIFQETYFTHIGIIYKDSIGNVYILENTDDKLYCHLTKEIKSGCLLLDFNERFDNLDNYRVHVVKTNLHKYINNDKLNESINKYKEYSFKLYGMNCVNYITKLLEENGLFKTSNSIIPLLPIDIFNKNNYNCDIIFEEPIIIKDIE